MKTSSVEAFRKLEAGLAAEILNKNKDLINKGLIDMEERLAEHGVSHQVRAAVIVMYLEEAMFKFVASIACCEENYKEKLERFGEHLRAKALKHANDPEAYRDVMRTIGIEPKAACHGEPAKPPQLLN